MVTFRASKRDDDRRLGPPAPEWRNRHTGRQQHSHHIVFRAKFRFILSCLGLLLGFASLSLSGFAPVYRDEHLFAASISSRTGISLEITSMMSFSNGSCWERPATDNLLAGKRDEHDLENMLFVFKGLTMMSVSGIL